jgi:hypothetical protein
MRVGPPCLPRWGEQAQCCAFGDGCRASAGPRPASSLPRAEVMIVLHPTRFYLTSRAPPLPRGHPPAATRRTPADATAASSRKQRSASAAAPMRLALLVPALFVVGAAQDEGRGRELGRHRRPPPSPAPGPPGSGSCVNSCPFAGDGDVSWSARSAPTQPCPRLTLRSVLHCFARNLRRSVMTAGPAPSTAAARPALTVRSPPSSPCNVPAIRVVVGTCDFAATHARAALLPLRR